MALTGSERKQIEEAQAKLERMRYERTHFSDGYPVARCEGLAPEWSRFGVIWEDEL